MYLGLPMWESSLNHRRGRYSRVIRYMNLFMDHSQSDLDGEKYLENVHV